MKIQIGLPDIDGLQKYRMFFEKVENVNDKYIIVKYNEWLETVSGRIFDFSTQSYRIENSDIVYYNKGEVKTPELFDEKGNLTEKATYYDGTEIKTQASTAYDEFYQITNTEKSTAIINETITNI